METALWWGNAVNYTVFCSLLNSTDSGYTTWNSINMWPSTNSLSSFKHWIYVGQLYMLNAGGIALLNYTTTWWWQDAGRICLNNGLVYVSHWYWSTSMFPKWQIPPCSVADIYILPLRWGLQHQQRNQTLEAWKTAENEGNNCTHVVCVSSFLCRFQTSASTGSPTK